VIELLAEKAGSRERVAQITDRAMRGEIDFAESLKERVATLKGLSTQAFTDVLSDVTITHGANALIDEIHHRGGLVGAVSGGFHEILDPLAPRLNLDFWRANRLDVESGVLTGRLRGEIIDAAAKARSLDEWAAENGISHADTVAIGDGANDIPMMQSAGISIAFCAKPIVIQVANFSISERDLSLAAEPIYGRADY
jgi:phosphoserine phosphatase